MIQSDCPSPPVPLPLPLLITGVAGVAGYNAFHFFHAKYPGQVIGMRRSKYWPLSGDGIVACDQDRDTLQQLFDEYQFKSVLNCGGSCKLKSCELDPEMAWRVNVTGVESLLDVVGQSDVRFVHLSIDLVFSGIGAGNHVEEDPLNPVTAYGLTMATAEQRITAVRPDACILRISLPMGISFNGHAGAIDWIQSRFKADKPATLYYDEIRTPTYTDCLNHVLSDVLAGNICGVFHAGGPRPLSLYQIAQIVNRVGGYDPNHLVGSYRKQAGPIPPRAGNVSLDSRKLAAALGYEPFDPWPYYHDQVPTHDQWHRERPCGEESCPELLADVLYNNPELQRDSSCGW